MSSDSALKQGSTPALDSIPDVDIDADGRFKYILIRVTADAAEDGGTEVQKRIVRGYQWAPYHNDIYEKVREKIEKPADGAAAALDCECLGGGRILHEASKKTIKVFGYSQGYGKADHSVTVELLKRKYPDYASITWSDEGY